MHYDKYHILRILFWVALVSSYVLAILPQEEVPKLTPFSDKGNHFIAFAFLTGLLLCAYRMKYLSAAVWMFAYGVFIELSQLFTYSRRSEVLDVLADSIGILIGLLLYKFMKKYISLC